MRAATRLASYSVFFLIVATDNVYAYLTPGTGSLPLQGLIAGIAGSLVVLRLYRAKGVPAFKKNKNDKSGRELSS